MCKLFLDFAATALNYVYLSLWSFTKYFLSIQGTAVCGMYYTMNDQHITLSKPKKGKRCKFFKILNKEI